MCDANAPTVLAGKNALVSLQVFRALAAMIVVVHHSCRAVTVNSGAALFGATVLAGNAPFRQFGSAGVDLFFVLSGFLMVHISKKYVSGEKSPGNFLLHRIVRVWPMYALVTLFLTLLNVWYQYRGTPMYELHFVRLLSFFFVPSKNFGGGVQPILGVGWTLNYEALFYLCFVVALVMKWGTLLVRLYVIVIGAWIVGLLAPAGSTASIFLGNTIVFEFLLGAFIANLYGLGLLSLPTVQCAVIGLAGLVLAACFPPLESVRFATLGVSAALVFIAFLQAPRTMRWPSFLVYAGNASYSIYLVHEVVIYKFGMPAFAKLALHGTVLSRDLAAATMVVTSLVVGLLAYRFVEMPAQAFARRVISERGTVA